MKKWTWFLSVFVVFISTASAVEKKVLVETPLEYEKTRKGRYIPEDYSYLERRPKWGVRLNFLSNEIVLVKEDGVADADIYEKDSLPFQIDFSVHRSFEKFSVAGEVGYLSAKFENMTNSISATGVFAGLGFYADGFFKTPYFVPFAFAGLVSLSGDLEGPGVGGVEADGTTPKNERSIETESFVPYYKLGFLIGLNWLERGTATKALSDYGLQNTFLYFAVKKITDGSTEEETVKLETDLYGEFGFQLEF